MAKLLKDKDLGAGQGVDKNMKSDHPLSPLDSIG